MAKNTIEELDRGQLELMWNFLKMGNGKPNIAALKENLNALRQLMIQKTAGQETYRKSYEIQYEDLGTIVMSNYNQINTYRIIECPLYEKEAKE